MSNTGSGSLDKDNNLFLATQKQEQRERWHTMLAAINRVMLALTLISVFFWSGAYLITQYDTLLLVVATVIIFLIPTTLSSLMLRVNRPGWLEAATCTAVFSQFLVMSMGTSLIGAYSGALSLFFWVPVAICLIGLSIRAIVATTAITIGFIAAILASQSLGIIIPPIDLAKDFPIANIFIWSISLFLVLFGMLTFSRRLQKSLDETNERNKQLAELTTQLKGVTDFGATLSHELSGVTSELNTTSQQQASGTQEQVASVNQVTSSLEELSESANQIAAAAHAAAAAANQTVTVATEVKESSQAAQSATKEGNQAIEQVISSVDRVRNRIEQLGQRLLELTGQNRRVGTIIDLIEEIADETHLLALNASIEAAGGINTNDSSSSLFSSHSNRSNRFNVIAQEVKNLADRSREATEEVRVAITEMQGAVAAAVLVAEEGRKETFAAVSRSQIAGAVIHKLNEVIASSAERAEEILGAVEEVKIRCDEISLATSQQRTANQQILQTMREVAQVSHQSASIVTHLSETVSRVNNQVSELSHVLDRSNQAMLVAASA